MQQMASFSGGSEDGGVNIQAMEDMTRLTDKQQMANFLTWGKWDLDTSSIEKLVKDEERKERVSSQSYLRSLPYRILLQVKEAFSISFSVIGHGSLFP